MVNKSRFWTFVSYSNTIFELFDFINVLKLHNIDFIISPLHNSDIGIKSHFHFLLVFNLEKSFDQVKKITDLIHCYPQICSSPHLMVRYFCHLDHPYKERYNIEDCMVYCTKSGLIDILLSNELG